MDSSSEATPQKLQGQRRPATYWLCAGARSNGNRRKMPIESPRAREQRWIVMVLRQYAFPLVFCCAVIALLLAWYIPSLFPGWHATTTRWLDAHMLFVIVLSIILLVFLVFWLLLWKFPQWQVADVPEVKDRIDLESKSRQTMAQILGGAALLVGLYFTSQTLQTTQEGQITDRFTKAITQLGDNNLAIRLGGIYALERIARDSESDHGAVIEVLTAFVREYSHGRSNPLWAWVPMLFAIDRLPDYQARPSPPADIQAILTVIGRRTRTFRNGEMQPLDLRYANLQGADLARAQLQGAILTAAQLQRTFLAEVQLQGAHLVGTQLQGALMGGAQLQGANLTGAQLQGAHLGGAQLQGANLTGAQLQKADLTGAIDLSQNQINVACIDEHTELPEGLARPAPCPYTTHHGVGFR